MIIIIIIIIIIMNQKETERSDHTTCGGGINTVSRTQSKERYFRRMTYLQLYLKLQSAGNLVRLSLHVNTAPSYCTTSHSQNYLFNGI